MNLIQRVLAGSLTIILVLVVLVVALATRRLETRLVGDSVQELAREARMIAASWHRGINADSLADAIGRQLQHRVTIVDSTGRVIGDSEFDRPALDALENHNQRPEIIEAR